MSPRPRWCMLGRPKAPSGGSAMRRRDLLKAGLGTAGALAAPRIVGAAAANKLVFVPTSDLTVLDPVVTFNRPTRNYAYLVFDTLYGIDTNWMAQLRWSRVTLSMKTVWSGP